ncbi:MAG: hypothetical protein Q7T44_05560 [Parvibaculum sp.]|nr:hypothetical protein [Parvibaculum sp.]
MRLSSLLKRRQKVKRPTPPEEEPRAGRGAIKRALRHSAAASNYRSAAILGERIATALSTIETAVLAIDVVNDRLREAHNLVAEAGKTQNLPRRELLAGRYDDVRSEIDAAVGAASHNRINLINGLLIGGQSPAFIIALDGEGRADIAVSVVNLTTGARGLALSPPRTGFSEDAEITMILNEIDQAQTRIVNLSMRFADHAALIADRLTRLQELAGNSLIESWLPTGADTQEPAEEDTHQPLNLQDEEVIADVPPPEFDNSGLGKV